MSHVIVLKFRAGVAAALAQFLERVVTTTATSPRLAKLADKQLGGD